MSEVDVGISAFLTPGPAIRGLIKHVISDFHVREVSEAGVADLAPDAAEAAPAPKPEPPAFDPAAWTASLRALVGDAADAVAAALFGPTAAPRVVIDRELDKEGRTAVHQLVKALPNYDSRTDGGRVVLVRGKKTVRGERAKGRITRMVLRKQNIDTADAAFRLARALNLGKNAVGFAGTKDKRGVTCQFITIPAVSEERIRAVLGDKLQQHVQVGNFTPVAEELHLGDLLGNEFRVVIRELDRPEEAARNAEGVSAAGFINYYGLQRFGSCKGNTHHVGRLLLLERFREATELIMAEANDSADVREVRRLFAEGKFREAFDRCPPKLRIERGILRALSVQQKQHTAATDGAFKAALDAGLPYTTKMLYVHAYQSHVWNIAASRRIAAHCAAVCAGDLVLQRRPGGPRRRRRLPESGSHRRPARALAAL